MNPESLIEAGQGLIGLGRHIQRTYPPPNVVGCQFDEQAVLDELLPGNDGIYVDCGAHHWCDCSNTWRLYERGWRGLLIEPNPEAWPGLLLARSEDYLAPVACSDREGYARLNLCRSVSSMDDCWRKDNEGSMMVMTERLGTSLARYKGLDWTKTRFCSLDVEGWERNVLLGIDWNTFRPDVFMVEHAAQDGSDQSSEWLPILTGQGYQEFFRNSLNLILVRKQ